MYEVIHLDNNTDYLQYAPFDIIAVDESFHKLYDRKKRMFQYDDQMTFHWNCYSIVLRKALGKRP